MTSILRWAQHLTRKTPLQPLRFPTTGFDIIPDLALLEEEQLDEFKEDKYFPVQIGHVYASKYQVLGKLGFGSTSTVWLARDLESHKHVTLKMYTSDNTHHDEFNIYETIRKVKSSHPGRRHVRSALDKFALQSPAGKQHYCLVQTPLWDSWRDLLRRNPTNRFTEDLLKAGLWELLLGLDYLHAECKLVHTDIKADNIHSELVDKQLFEAFTQAELETPTPRKYINGFPIYLSRKFGLPRELGNVILSDFGAAVRGDERRNHDAQPNVYRSPEVMLKVRWSYPVDIWNVGVMIWDLFEGKHLFYGDDPSGEGYLTRAHLAEVIGMLGPPPLDLLQRGQWKAGIPIPEGLSLEASEENLEGSSEEKFLSFIRGMLQWRPEDRKTAKQLLEDPWFRN
ncbi:hypothetical protein MY8738_008261 [Beauveria namnaoensis]